MININTTRLLASTAGGILWSVAQPALPYAGLCTAMVLADTVTAWTLSRRVAARYGTEARRQGAGKIQSRRLGAMVVTLAKIYALLLLASATDHVLFPDGEVHVLRFCTGAVCLWQAVSVLENEASCSNAVWARIARRWLIDKVTRHFSEKK